MQGGQRHQLQGGKEGDSLFHLVSVALAFCRLSQPPLVCLSHQALVRQPEVYNISYVVAARQHGAGCCILDVMRARLHLGQVTPGPIVITATFVGYLLHGITGAVVATLAVFLPSFLIVIAAAPHFDRLRASPMFGKLITGALCAFPGLLLIVTVRFTQSVGWDMPRIVLAGVAFAALRLGTNILWVVLVGTGLSLIFTR